MEKLDCFKVRRDTEALFNIDLMSKDRHTEKVAMRSAFYNAILSKEPQVVLTELGKSCGVDHSTIIHHRKHHDHNMMEVNHPFNKTYRFWYRKFVDSIFVEQHLSRVHKRMLIGSL